MKKLFGVILLIMLSAGCMMVCLAYIKMVSAMNERPVEIRQADQVLILGAGLWGDRVSETLRLRLEAGIEQMQQHPKIRVILTGGQGVDEWIPEADAMAAYMTERGIVPERLMLERKSRSTKENLQFSKQMADQMGLRMDRIVIITSDYHLYRAMWLAEQMGMQAEGIAAASPETVKTKQMIREVFAIWKDWLFHSERFIIRRKI